MEGVREAVADIRKGVKAGEEFVGKVGEDTYKGMKNGFAGADNIRKTVGKKSRTTVAEAEGFGREAVNSVKYVSKQIVEGVKAVGQGSAKCSDSEQERKQ
ncbi:hypothetical protein HDU76_004869 [Blyttiomyces sp. JEL0837]|nr:hypothetical protein HDU76_004869 [Blyttiomyces sp. JEL0837]